MTTYTVVAGRYLKDDNDKDYEKVNLCRNGLNAADAKELYYKSRGYQFSRIEVDGVPGVDVSNELYGVQE